MKLEELIRKLEFFLFNLKIICQQNQAALTPTHHNRAHISAGTFWQFPTTQSIKFSCFFLMYIQQLPVTHNTNITKIKKLTKGLIQGVAVSQSSPTSKMGLGPRLVILEHEVLIDHL